jgi:3-carboxy-cis,cis-muconate cycloisomerase
MSDRPTSTTVLDSILSRDAFGTPQMRAVFSDRALIARYIEVEIALARAEARCGVIPVAAADAIARCCDLDAIDVDLLRTETDNVGYPILPLVHQLVKQCGEAGRWLLWGATTQDIMDSAVVLQMRDGLALIGAEIPGLRKILTDLAQRHRDTPMAGRTHLQQALPVIFRYKAAIWLAMLDRHAERLAQLQPRAGPGSSPAPPARSPRSATRVLPCRPRCARSSGSAFRSQPRTWRATASPRPSTSSASSPARSARSRSTG